MSVQRLEKLKEQLERVVELDSDIIKTYKIVQSAKYRGVMHKHMKKMKSFVFVIKKQLEVEGKLKPNTDEEFEFVLSEIDKQVTEAVDNWNTDKERMGAAHVG